MDSSEIYTIVDDEFYEYLIKRSNKQDLPVRTEEWIQSLAERAGISECYAVIGYQYLRNATCRIRQHTVSENPDKEVLEWLDEKKSLFLKKSDILEV